VPRILSGVQPTGNTHLGNYVGAFRQWVEMQHDFEAFHPVVDLHAITLPYDPETLADRTLEVAAILLAAGLDPEVSTVFVQSHVPEHTELAWLLNHLATVGELRRMTQFKAKAEVGGEGSLPAGYFNYPVLQAADILIYQADRVPVGEDQRQHLELTRERGPALQRPLRPDLRGPRGLHPAGGRPGHGPPGPDGQDVEVERVAGRAHRAARPRRRSSARRSARP
jgi:tryptophanyl-tRNA synthetase